MLLNNAVESTIQMLDWCDLPKAISGALFPIEGTPSSKWSLLNRTIMVSNGSLDSRGVKQWQYVLRYPVKSARNIYLVAPKIKTINDKKEVVDWVSVPVIPVNNTYGDPIQYAPYKPKRLLVDPLSEQFKLKMKGINRYYDVITSIDETNPELAVSFEKQFFWNVCLNQYKETCNNTDNQEMALICEISTLAILYLIGRKVNYVGRHIERIKKVAQSQRLSTIANCFSVIHKVEMVLKEILNKCIQEI